MLFMVVNIPVVLYSWLYLNTYVPLAGLIYLVLYIGLAASSAYLLSQRNGEQPDTIFGCSAMLGILPGIPVALFCLVPYFQLVLTPPALNIPVDQASQHSQAEFFVFQEALVRSDLEFTHSEERSQTVNKQRQTYTATFRVAPVAGKNSSQDSFSVWMTSEDTMTRLDKSRNKSWGEVDGRRVVHADKGFLTAVALACEQHGWDEPKQPILLEPSKGHTEELEDSQYWAIFGLVVYNACFLMLGAFVVSLRR